MAKVSKRFQAIKQKVDSKKIYTVSEALALLKEVASAKFNESVDLSVRLGIDPRKETVRGSTVLPNGTGKVARVAVFAQEDKAKEATSAGADLVGFEDLAASIKKGELDFDILIATPDTMVTVGQLGQILGPRGLMPNPKTGTVTFDVAEAIKRAKSGQVNYRAEKGGIVHCTIGKVDFSVESLLENLRAMITALKKAKPSTSKGVFLRKVHLSTTMGPGLDIEISSIED